MKIGKIVTYKKQRFEFVGVWAFIRKSGRKGWLQIWSSHCRKCKQLFWESYGPSKRITPRGPAGIRPTRVCKEHRRPPRGRALMLKIRAAERAGFSGGPPKPRMALSPPRSRGMEKQKYSYNW